MNIPIIVFSFYAAFDTTYHPLVSKTFSLDLHDIAFSWSSCCAGCPLSVGLANIGVLQGPAYDLGSFLTHDFSG